MVYIPYQKVEWLDCFLKKISPYLAPDFRYSSLLVTDQMDLLTDNLQTDGKVAMIALGDHEGGGVVVDGRLEDVKGKMLIADPLSISAFTDVEQAFTLRAWGRKKLL